jgi:hypothetical protein
MRTIALLLLLGVAPITALAADYKSGWTPDKFYDEVATCRSAVVMPAINGYLAKGAEHKRPAEEMRNEAISMLPIFEQSASAACFCAVNETAKAQDFASYFGSGDFTARMKVLGEQVNGQLCGDKMRSALSELQTKEKREALQLK